MKRASRWASAIVVLTACREPDPAAGSHRDERAAKSEPADPIPGPDARRDPPKRTTAEDSSDGAVVDLRGVPLDPLRADDDVAATVLLFVSTHCPISNRYAPTIQGLATEWSQRGVAAWLVYPDPDDDPAAIDAHRQGFSLELPAVRDPGHRLVERAKARVTPEAAVFVPGAEAPVYTGRIDDRVVEFGSVREKASSRDLHDAVRAVLDGDRPRPAEGPAVGCYISDLR